MITRVLRQLRRIRNARRIGVSFWRNATFEMPQSMHLNGQNIAIASSGESGARLDFLLCCVHDEYGLRSIGTPVAKILDIGANLGFFSLAARACFPQAEIEAYEPNARVWPYLAINAKVGGFSFRPEAVGSKEGWVVMEDSGDSNQARTLSVPSAVGGVKQTALAAVIERLGGSVDLAKIDCEGAEWDLFEDKESWRRIADVRMEYHLCGNRVFNDVERALFGLGFEIGLHSPAGGWGTIWARNRDPVIRP